MNKVIVKLLGHHMVDGHQHIPGSKIMVGPGTAEFLINRKKAILDSGAPELEKLRTQIEVIKENSSIVSSNVPNPKPPQPRTRRGKTAFTQKPLTPTKHEQ